MIEVKKGVEFLLDTSNTKHDETDLFQVVFCHKDEKGNFVHGVTSEEIMKMMLARYSMLVMKDSSAENIRTMLHLRQAYQSITDRNYSRISKKKRNDNYRNDIPVQASGPKG